MHWFEDFRAVAVETCNMNNCLNCVCTPDDSGMPCINGFTCVVQDEFWSQCIGEMALLRGGFTMRTSGHVRMWLKTTHTHTLRHRSPYTQRPPPPSLSRLDCSNKKQFCTDCTYSWEPAFTEVAEDVCGLSCEALYAAGTCN